MKSSELTQEQLERIQQALALVPFAHLIGIRFERAGQGVATLALDVRDELKQNNGVVHGGAIASLIDTATAIAIISALAPGDWATTVDLTISYLRPLLKGRAIATAKVLRAGRRLIVASAEVVDAGGTLLATALTSYIKI
jgi:uncharacterized protein (TIGR00369 family)